MTYIRTYVGCFRNFCTHSDRSPVYVSTWRCLLLSVIHHILYSTRRESSRHSDERERVRENVYGSFLVVDRTRVMCASFLCTYVHECMLGRTKTNTHTHKHTHTHSFVSPNGMNELDVQMGHCACLPFFRGIGLDEWQTDGRTDKHL